MHVEGITSLVREAVLTILLFQVQANNYPGDEEVDRLVFLSSAQFNPRSGEVWSVNNRSWTEKNEHLGGTPYNITTPSVGIPYLVDIYNNGQAAIPNYTNAVQNYGGWSPEQNTYVAKTGEIIDIILLNEPNGVLGGFDAHPWHVHGGHIYDLGSGRGDYNRQKHLQQLKGYNPVIRDTTLLWKYVDGDGIGTMSPYSVHGWRAWRLHVQDAG